MVGVQQEPIVAGLAPGCQKFSKVRALRLLGIDKADEVANSLVIAIWCKPTSVKRVSQVDEVGVQNVRFAVVADFLDLPGLEIFFDL